MRRGLLLLSTVLICLALAPVASAKKPARQINPSQDDVVITDNAPSRSSATSRASKSSKRGPTTQATPSSRS